MTEGANEVVFTLRFGSGSRNETARLIVPLTVGPDVYLGMVFQPTMPHSSISMRVLRDLQGRGLVPVDADDAITLPDLKIDGQPVPDLDVRVGLTATIFQFDGMLGFDFFSAFATFQMDLRTLKVTLTRA